MNILFLTNNDISQSVYKWLDARENVTIWNDKLKAELIRDNGIGFIISYCYRYIIRKEILDLLPNRVINCHISLLPWNRGADPNIWSFIDDTPSGFSIHYVDEGLDTGDIIMQKGITFDKQKDTLRSAYHMLHDAMTECLCNNYETITGGGACYQAAGQWKSAYHERPVACSGSNKL
jgi:methionyl-tRNA formyltransferase